MPSATSEFYDVRVALHPSSPVTSPFPTSEAGQQGRSCPLLRGSHVATCTLLDLLWFLAQHGFHMYWEIKGYGFRLRPESALSAAEDWCGAPDSALNILMHPSTITRSHSPSSFSSYPHPIQPWFKSLFKSTLLLTSFNPTLIWSSPGSNPCSNQPRS